MNSLTLASTCSWYCPARMAKTHSPSSGTEFRFARLDSLGAAAAEHDEQFLIDCFVETDEANCILDTSNPRTIVVGRTGAGKTALLRHIERSTRAITIEPEALALAHISNSTILRFLDELGVDLDVFFKLLWRHIIAVEILRARFPSDGRNFLDKLLGFISGPRYREALEYLRDWGESFWEETEYRTREITRKLEKELEASVEAALPEVGKLGGHLARRLTEEQRQEVVNRTQKIVNEVQIKKLADVIKLIDHVLDDPQKPFYVLIDRLDENWVEDGLRLRLIRALLGTASDFQKVRHAKVVLALRLDLLLRVFRRSRRAGFQEEKFESLYLRLEWSKAQLNELLNKRIGELVVRRFAKKTGVTYGDVFPLTIDKQPSFDYMLARTAMRPRDVILFANACIHEANGKSRISATAVKTAEAAYSQARLESLGDEWSSDYPNLVEFSRLLYKQPYRFHVRDLSKEACEEFCLERAITPRQLEDSLSRSAIEVANAVQSYRTFLASTLAVFYAVGLVGLKPSTGSSYIWSSTKPAPASEITEATGVEIHPAFWRALSTQHRK